MMKMKKQNCSETLAVERKMAPKGIYIRSLTEEDRNTVDNLDELSGNYVAQWLEGNTDYAWGLFADSKLIGYCSIGEAEDVSAVISSYPGYTCDSLILSDVFVLPEYRKQGLGLYMVEQVIKERNKENNLIFLKPFCDSLGYFYDKLGFRYIDGNEEMVWDHNAICSETVELCPFCSGENVYQNWDIKKNGYKARCQYCGRMIMLCDECLHADDNPYRNCDERECSNGRACKRGFIGSDEINQTVKQTTEKGENLCAVAGGDLSLLTKVKELIDQLIGENEPSDADLDYNDAAIQVYADLHNLKESMKNMGL